MAMIFVLRTAYRIRELNERNSAATHSSLPRYNQTVARELDATIRSHSDKAITTALKRSLGAKGAELLLHCMKLAEPPTALVGGWLRDLSLGTVSGDVDLVTAKPDAFAREMQEQGASKAVLLDAVRRTWRVVLPGGAYVDISAPRGPQANDLLSDLSLRDLCVNAMAWSPDLGWLDPLCGLEDLRDKCLRPASGSALTDDPLRALRSWRLAIHLKMSLAPDLKRQMQGLKLEAISGERCVAELTQILLHEDACHALRGLQEAGLLQQLLPGRTRFKALSRCIQGPYTSKSLACCIKAIYEQGDAWLIGLRLGHLLEAPKLKKELLNRRWSRRSARLAAITSAQVSSSSEALSDQQLDADLRRWKDASAAGILGRVALLDHDSAEQLASRYLTVLNGRALGGALTNQLA